MNNLLNLVWNWANKLTAKILTITGVPDDKIEAWSKAVDERNKQEEQAVDKSKTNIDLFGMGKLFHSILTVILLGGIMFFAYKFLYKYFRKIKLF